MKRLGPELKMPELKPPAFLADLYYDLRDRRLLPLVVLVLVAIAAVPFLLGGDAEEPLPEEAGIAAEAGVAGEGGADASSLTVVEATPGLRDYRKRLKRRAPSDPFVQQYTEPEGGSGEGSGGGGSASGAGSVSLEVEESEGDETVETVPVPSGGGSGGASPPGQLDPGDSGLHFFAFRPDVRFGVAGSGELTLHRELPAGQVLPKQNPVVVFVGPSESGSRVFFDVSHEVAMVKGPGRCIGGPQSCSLLSLKAGQAADILTGVPGRAFRLKVERIEFVEVERPKPAGSSSATRQSWGFDLSQSFSK